MGGGEKGSTRNQYIAAIMMNLTQFTYGCVIGWMSPVMVLLQSEDSPSGAPVDDLTMTWMAACLPIGCLVATPIFGYICEAHGRKVAAISVSVPSVISWSMKLISATPWNLIVARFLAGVSAGGSLVVTTMYVGEISEPKCRGSLGALLMFINVSGILIGYIVGGLTTYMVSASVFLIPPVLHIVTFFMMPETPEYLVKVNNTDKAAKSVGWLRSLPPYGDKVQSEVNKLIEKKYAKQNEPKITLRNLLSERANRRGLMIVFFLQSFQAWNGGYAVTSYVGVIFNAAFGGDTTEDYGEFARLILSNVGSSAVVGTLMVMGGLVGVLLVERCGRRPLLIGSYICGGSCMFTLATWFYLIEVDVNAPSWIPVVALSLFMFTNMAGAVPVPLVILSEVFSFEVRSSLTSIVLGWTWISAFIQLMTFTPLSNLLGIYSLMWIYTGIAAIALLFSIFLVPETKGKSLDEIARELGGKPAAEIPEKPT